MEKELKNTSSANKRSHACFPCYYLKALLVEQGHRHTGNFLKASVAFKSIWITPQVRSPGLLHMGSGPKWPWGAWSEMRLVSLQSWMDQIVNQPFWLFSRSVMSDCWWPHGLQHTRLPCPSPSPGACSNSCPLSWWCHPTISSSVVPFSSCLQLFLVAGSFPVSWFFTSGGQSIGASTSASVLPINIRVDFL